MPQRYLAGRLCSAKQARPVPGRRLAWLSPCPYYPLLYSQHGPQPTWAAPARMSLGHGIVMRVIAGKFRSRTLKALPGLETRPTYDRLKETLFNVLAAAGELEGAVFLDLFAGTGSIGIEALSRGAARGLLRRVQPQGSPNHPRQPGRLGDYRGLRDSGEACDRRLCSNFHREGCAAASASLILLTKWKAHMRKCCAL